MDFCFSRGRSVSDEDSMDSLLQQMSFSGDDATYDVVLCLMTIPCSLCSISGHSLYDDDPMESVPSVVILCLMIIPSSLCSISGHSLSDDDPMESVLSVVILCLMTVPCNLFHQWSFSV